MIYLTGDTHGEFERIARKNFSAGSGDYLIICGDFGGIWEDSPYERYWLRWLSEKPFTTLFVDGNHENYDMLSYYPVTLWNGGKVQKINDKVIHLMRGQVFDIDGIRFFTMGGAASHDISDGVLDPDDSEFESKKRRLSKMKKFYRINHITWWKEEMPSSDEMEEGLANLERVGNSVDVILSHACPSHLLDIFSHGKFENDILTDYLEGIANTCEFKCWFFGHYHMDMELSPKYIMMYNEIISLADHLK